MLNPFAAVVVTITVPPAASVQHDHPRVAHVLLVATHGVGDVSDPVPVGAVVSGLASVKYSPSSRYTPLASPFASSVPTTNAQDEKSQLTSAIMLYPANQSNFIFTSRSSGLYIFHSRMTLISCPTGPITPSSVV